MEKNKEYLLIIDGSSLLSTQFYGNLPREILFAKTAEEKKYKGAYATDKITAVTLYPRRWGANVRCVKETKTE